MTCTGCQQSRDALKSALARGDAAAAAAKAAAQGVSLALKKLLPAKKPAVARHRGGR